MFTGLITHVGEIMSVAQRPRGRELAIRVPWNDIALGESVAVNGICLTVAELIDGGFLVAAVPATVATTTAGDWSAGAPVNLERALRAGDRLGGHIVQGHVDGVGRIEAVQGSGDDRRVGVALWPDAGPLCVPHGSIALDGVSLTIQAVHPSPGVTVAIIDHTLRHTTLGRWQAGDRVNVELDVIGKYVRQLAAPWGAPAGAVR